jgi:hypothetical protein
MKVRYENLIPRSGKLAPKQEKEFQAYMAFDPAVRDWRNAFMARAGGPPQIDNDPTYDYRKAWASNDGPRMGEKAADGTPHWGSAGKAENHPTEWKAQFMGKFGADPDAIAESAWTPQMRQYLNESIRETIVGRFARGARYDEE